MKCQKVSVDLCQFNDSDTFQSHFTYRLVVIGEGLDDDRSGGENVHGNKIS